MFEDVLSDLSLHPEAYGFIMDERSQLIAIQEAFGFIVNHATGQIIGRDLNMDDWWTNFDNSRNLNGLMWEVYQYFLDILKTTNNPFYI